VCFLPVFSFVSAAAAAIPVQIGANAPGLQQGYVEGASGALPVAGAAVYGGSNQPEQLF
jgi:hypothetical protein